MFAPLPSMLVHLHGAVFSSWMILFVVQCGLVSAGNLRLHRRLGVLGVLGAVLAGLMVVLGILTSFGTLRRGMVLPSFFTPASFPIGNCVEILLFGALVGLGVWQRNNRPVHKRLMFLANVLLLAPALFRMTFPVMVRHPLLVGGIPLAMVVALLIFDLVTRRRLLLVTVAGLVLLLGFNPILGVLLRTPAAQHLTAWAQHRP